MKKTILVVTQPEVTHKVGGAISMFVFLTNLLAESGYEVCGVCNSTTEHRPAGLHPGVSFYNLFSVDHSTEGFAPKMQNLIREKKPSCIIFFFHYLYIQAELGREFDAIPRILTFHSRPDFYFAFVPHSERKLRALYRNTTAQILFDSYKSLLPRFIRKGPVCTIPNPVLPVSQSHDTEHVSRKVVFLSRIDRCKGLDLLIPAFAAAIKIHQDWNLDIWGEFETEELRQEYMKLVVSREAENHIHFKGVTSKPLQTLCEYDFCVFPSRFEGFSVGLAESLSVGLPCVGLKKCSGVNEMIIDGYNGLLSEDSVEDMTEKIVRLMESDDLRSDLSQGALAICERYHVSHIQWQWRNLVEHVVQPVKPDKLFPVKQLVQLISRS